MAEDERVFMMGEDVGVTGGIFQVSKGLMDRFGEERVRDTPISEATFVGCGVGAAIAGMRVTAGHHGARCDGVGRARDRAQRGARRPAATAMVKTPRWHGRGRRRGRVHGQGPCAFHCTINPKARCTLLFLW